MQGVPALVIEIVSDNRMDRVRKRDIYARVGVDEYWIVDPEADRIEVYRLIGNLYAKPEIYEAGETLVYGPLPASQSTSRTSSRAHNGVRSSKVGPPEVGFLRGARQRPG